MKPAQSLSSCHIIIGLAVAGAALLSAPAAFAQTSPSPFYSFQVTNLTASGGGDPLYSVTDDLTFSNLQINEVFADSFTETIQISNPFDAPGTLSTGTVAEQTGAFYFDASTPGSLVDPIHGKLTNAILTGSLDNGLNPGSTIDVTLQPTFDPTAATTQTISDTFSADLLHPVPVTIGLGDFSLVDASNNTPFTVVIGANPVPEASTVVSMGLMLALGLGALLITRRRTAAAAH